LDLRRSLELHKRLAMTFAAVGLALGVAYYLATGRVYSSQALVFVQPAPAKVMEAGAGSRNAYDSAAYESYMQQQMQNATRADVLAAAIKQLGGAWQKADESEQAAEERLTKTVEVTRVANTYQFSIEARASTPELAALVANALAHSYLESARRDAKMGDTERLKMLGEERERIQDELATDRAEQESLNRQLGVASVGNAPDHYDEDIGQIRTELVKARTDHDAAEARFTAMGAGDGATSAAIDAEAEEIASKDPGLMSMKQSLNGRRAALISLMANLTPANPQYKQDAAELAQINSNLDAMAKDLRAKAAERIQLGLRSELERTAGVESQLNGQLRLLVSTATGATSKLQRSNDLVADITRLQNRFTTVDEQWRNLNLEDGAPGGAYLSSPAVAPLHAARSGRTRTAALIVLAGLFLGLLAAVVKHKMDPRVYVGSDVEQVLGYAPMALLPEFDEVSAGVSEEHLLRLAAAIEYGRKNGSLKSLIFTGAGPGTGVTTVVTRVRSMLEAMGRTTVLVDASGTEPAAAESSSQGEAGGQALVAQRGSRPTALLQRMAEQTEVAQETLVLTDTAPLVVSAETEYLARFTDCAIVVLESGVTTRAEIRKVAATLERLDVSAVGFVLNRVGLAKADPAFRLSIEAMENHLRAQQATMVRKKEQAEGLDGSKLDEPAPPAVEPAAEENSAQKQLKDLAEAAKAAGAALAASAAVPEKKADEERPVAAASPDAALPWWLTDLKRKPEPAASPLLWQPAKEETAPAVAAEATPVAEAAQVELPAAAVEAVVAEVPATAATPAEVQEVAPPPEQPERKSEWTRPSLFSPPRRAPVAEPAPVSRTIPTPQPAPPAQPVQGSPVAPVAQSPAAAPAAPAAAEFEAPLPNRASRLSGLRNLFFQLGVRDAHAPVSPVAEPIAPPVPVTVAWPRSKPSLFDETNGQTPYARTISSIPTATPGSGPTTERAVSGARMAPGQGEQPVTAISELLPPERLTEPAESDGAREGDGSDRVGRRESFDGIQLLPSRKR
jgi:uncharacterized protein involved in exopolysaccharide biosynthesis/Mrp family chromosome partitioning ATPase